MNNVMGLYLENMAGLTCKTIDIEYMGYLVAKGFQWVEKENRVLLG